MHEAGRAIGSDRARIRAALIRLRTLYPLEAWPAMRVAQYQRLFGERWATSENGIGVREVLKVRTRTHAL